MKPQWHLGWDAEVLGNPAVDREEARVADHLVDRAQERAPKRTGAGAASIHKEKRRDGYAVGWDRDHDYMRFLEFGTEFITARSFLRSAVLAAGR